MADMTRATRPRGERRRAFADATEVPNQKGERRPGESNVHRCKPSPSSESLCRGEANGPSGPGSGDGGNEAPQSYNLQEPDSAGTPDREPRRGDGAVMCVCRFYPRRSWDRLQHHGPGPHSLMTDGTNDGSQERLLSRLPSTPDLEADLALTSLLIDSLLLSHASWPMFQDSDLDNLCLPAFPHFLC